MAENSKGENSKDFKKTTNGQDMAEEMNQMFLRIINKTDVNIKSQQRSETDLTNNQKMQILKDLFEESPKLFLNRFGKWISSDDFGCFFAASGTDMEYTIGVLKKDLKAKGVCVKNRRFEALQRLEKDSHYFSDEEMRERCPFLYEQYIGQYMTDEEKFAQDEAKLEGEVKMSSFIFQQMDREWLRQKEMEEREMEECVEEEEEEEDEEEEEEEEEKEEDEDSEGHDKDKKGNYKDKGHDVDLSGAMEDSEVRSPEVTNLCAEEKLKLREEFLNIMRQRFLEGQDEEFDYAKVDTNEEYDNLEIRGQDEEDKYFDGEEPEIFNVESKEEKMSTDSEEDDYLSDKILEKCCAAIKC